MIRLWLLQSWIYVTNHYFYLKTLIFFRNWVESVEFLSIVDIKNGIVEQLYGVKFRLPVSMKNVDLGRMISLSFSFFTRDSCLLLRFLFCLYIILVFSKCEQLASVPFLLMLTVVPKSTKDFFGFLGSYGLLTVTVNKKTSS